MPNYFVILAVVFAVFFAIFYLWFIVSIRKTERAFTTLVAHPEQVAEFWRTGEDGDGYNRLHVRTTSGAELVIGHLKADEAEKILRAACDVQKWRPFG